jgi:hypothetical protein
MREICYHIAWFDLGFGSVLDVIPTRTAAEGYPVPRFRDGGCAFALVFAF